jgi:hypothetical protein
MHCTTTEPAIKMRAEIHAKLSAALPKRFDIDQLIYEAGRL